MVTQFNIRQFDPFSVGFDRMWDQIENLQNSAGFPQKGYPPYNIVKQDDTRFSIEMAVAGFTEEEVAVVLEKNELTISGKVKGSDEEVEVIHQGIATRNFERKFTLSESIEVTECKLENGMLVVRLEKIVAEEDKPKNIPINTSLSRDDSKELLTEE
mgnify:CR=1 FL=1